ncbi:hypothetical protein BXO88_14120 [Oribacterium sp. C9]|nr:hypothetical protein BXO88_14120 [Oribacterium sp. C9]
MVGLPTINDERPIFSVTNAARFVNIMASPNVSQVLQNNKKYRLNGVVGKNHKNIKVYNDAVGSNIIYDKLYEEVSKICKAETRNNITDMSKVLLVIDEAHQLVDATYRQDIIDDVKKACRLVADNGGIVIYTTATPLHICMEAPSRTGRILVDGIFESARDYSSIIEFRKNNDKPNFENIEVELFNDIRNFPYEILKGVEAGKYFLIQNNDKDYNLHIVKYLEANGIAAVAMSSDDTNYSVKADSYTNIAYNDIVKDGLANLGPDGIGYQVILTTCLLNNGTSIDGLVYEDEDVRKNTECVFVCNKAEDLNIEDMNQFFVRIRYNHSQNRLFLPVKTFEKGEDKAYVTLESFVHGFIDGDLRPKHISVEEKNILVKKAGEAYCTRICKNEDYLVRALREYLRTPVSVVHNLDERKNGIYDSETVDWTYSKNDVDSICSTILSLTSDKSEGKLFSFCNWEVNPETGYNETREQINAVDPALSKHFADILTLYVGGSNTVNTTELKDDIRGVFKTADYEYKNLRKSLSALEDRYRKLFFVKAKDDLIIKKAVEDYGMIESCAQRAKFKNSRGKIFLRYKNNISTMISDIMNSKFCKKQGLFLHAQDHKNFYHKWLQLVFNDRFMLSWLDFVVAGTGNGYGILISWERKCLIGALMSTVASMESFTDYIKVNTAINFTVNSIGDGQHTDSLVWKIANTLLQKPFAQIFGAYDESTNTISWKNTKITYEGCTEAVGLLRSELKAQGIFIHETDECLRRKILRLYGYMFTYKERPRALRIKRGNGTVMHVDANDIYITGIRKDTSSIYPIFLSFVAKNLKKKKNECKTALETLKEVFKGSSSSDSDITETVKRSKYAGMVVTCDLAGLGTTKMYDLAKIVAVDGSLAPFVGTVALYDKILFNGLEPVAVASVDCNGVLVGPIRTVSDFNADAYTSENSSWLTIPSGKSLYKNVKNGQVVFDTLKIQTLLK